MSKSCKIQNPKQFQIQNKNVQSCTYLCIMCLTFTCVLDYVITNTDEHRKRINNRQYEDCLLFPNRRSHSSITTTFVTEACYRWPFSLLIHLLFASKLVIRHTISKTEYSTMLIVSLVIVHADHSVIWSENTFIMVGKWSKIAQYFNALV